MFNFNFYVSPDTAALERRMSEFEAKADEIRGLVLTEIEQSAAREAKLAETAAKVDALSSKVAELTEMINSDTFPKEAVLSFLGELSEVLPEIVPTPDAPHVSDPPAESPPAE